MPETRPSAVPARHHPSPLRMSAAVIVGAVGWLLLSLSGGFARAGSHLTSLAGRLATRTSPRRFVLDRDVARRLLVAGVAVATVTTALAERHDDRLATALAGREASAAALGDAPASPDRAVEMAERARRAESTDDATEHADTPLSVAAAPATAPSPTAAPHPTTTIPVPPTSTSLAPTGRALAAGGVAIALTRQVIPAKRGALPVGKGMWIWMPQRTEGGDVSRIVQRAVDVGLTHLYVRTGSSWQGFYAQDFLNRLLPVAHRAGIRIFGWDFPNLADWQVDAQRSLDAIRYTTPDGHRIDGFAADIETGSEGTRISPEPALAYGTYLRQGVGNGYPLIACVPRPSKSRASYPFPHVVAQFDAIAPMVYWLNRQPGPDVAGAIEYLKRFGKPIMPVGQAYDGAPEGGRPGVPPRNELLAFSEVAERHGAIGVSFWSWQSANQPAWDAIHDASQFVVYHGRNNQTGGRNKMVQGLLTSLGYPAPATGNWDETTQQAIRAYQRDAGLPQTGELDGDTRNRLLTPFAPPIRPLPR